jgi:DNA-binding GntR family transcriptional regulator
MERPDSGGPKDGYCIQLAARDQVRGVFRPGQRLVEANLCELMRVSRDSVREALRRLEAENLVA